MLKLSILGLLLALQSPSLAIASHWTGNANIFLGAKSLPKEDWEPAEKHGEFGIELDFRPPDWPVNLVIDFLGSSGEGMIYDPTFGEVTVEGTTSEIDLGLRKIWDDPKGGPQPFIGGGISFASGTGKLSNAISEAEDSGRGSGIWLGGGVYWTLGKSFNLGVEARLSSAEGNIFGEDIQLGGGHFGFLLGWHWGGTSHSAAYDEQEWKTPRTSTGRGVSLDKATAPDQDLELEREKLDIERQRLQLERERLEFEKQKLQK